MAEDKKESTVTVTLKRGRVYNKTMYGPGEVAVPARVAKAFALEAKRAGKAAPNSVRRGGRRGK